MTASRATYARQWRLSRRQSRRFDTLTSDYVLTKYPEIYKEITEFYESLNSKYGTKHNLTKTVEYRLWKAEQETGRTTEQETGRTTEQETGRTTEKQTGRTTEQETGRMTTTEQEMSRITTTEQEMSRIPTTEQEMTDDPEQETDRITTTEQETGRTTEQEMTDLIPQYDLGLNDMDNIIDNIVNELQQDDQIRALMGELEFDQCIW